MGVSCEAHDRVTTYHPAARCGFTRPGPLTTAGRAAGPSAQLGGGRGLVAGGGQGAGRTSSPATTQPTRTSADSTSVLVNPVAAGRPCTMPAPTKVAAIWPPTTPPSVRSTAYARAASDTTANATLCRAG
jgi:hypothetical protein